MRELAPHPRREAICTVVGSRPGECFRSLARLTGMPPGTLAHHLRVLKREGLVQEMPLGARRIFFAAGGPLPDEGAATLMREAPLAALHGWLVREGPASQRKALDEMGRRGWPRSTTQHRLERLQALGLVSIRRSGRYVFYHPTDGQRAAPLPIGARLPAPAGAFA